MLLQGALLPPSVTYLFHCEVGTLTWGKWGGGGVFNVITKATCNVGGAHAKCFSSYFRENMCACRVSSRDMWQETGMSGIESFLQHDYLTVSSSSCPVASSPHMLLVLRAMSHRGCGFWTFNESPCAFSSNCHDNRSPIFTRFRSGPLLSYRVNTG